MSGLSNLSNNFLSLKEPEVVMPENIQAIDNSTIVSTIKKIINKSLSHKKDPNCYPFFETNQLCMKPHYPILDGLRRTAAILVVIFHLFEAF